MIIFELFGSTFVKLIVNIILHIIFIIEQMLLLRNVALIFERRHRRVNYFNTNNKYNNTIKTKKKDSRVKKVNN